MAARWQSVRSGAPRKFSVLIAQGPVANAFEVGCAAGAFTQRLAQGVPEWDQVYRLFSYPRGAECYVADERPRWSGAPHGGGSMLSSEAITHQHF